MVNSLGGFSFSQRVNSLDVVSLIYTFSYKYIYILSKGQFPRWFLFLSKGQLPRCIVSLIYTYTQKVNSLGRFPFSSLSLVLWSLFPHTSIYTRKQESKSIQHCKTNKNTHASFFRCVQNKLWRGSLMEGWVWNFSGGLVEVSWFLGCRVRQILPNPANHDLPKSTVFWLTRLHTQICRVRQTNNLRNLSKRVDEIIGIYLFL